MRAGAMSGGFRRPIATGIVLIVSACSTGRDPLAEAVAAPTNELTVQVSARAPSRGPSAAPASTRATRSTRSSSSSTWTTPADTDAAHTPRGRAHRQPPNYPTACHWPSINAESDAAPDRRPGRPGHPGRRTRPARRPVPDLGARRRLQDRRRALHHAAPGRRTWSPSSCSRTRCPTPPSGPGLRGQRAHQRRPRHRRPASRGFVGHITDILGEITDRRLRQPAVHDVRGRGPGHARDPAGATSTPTCCPSSTPIGGKCVSDADGIADDPAPGHQPLHASVTPPDGQTWIQTTTLEGNHDYDAWIMEGATGYDTEFALAGEPVPDPSSASSSPPNGSRSTAAPRSHQRPRGAASRPTPRPRAAPSTSGAATPAPRSAPDPDAWLSLADLRTATWPSGWARATPTARFDIAGVPDGNYTLSWWDEPQDYNLNMINVTVAQRRDGRAGAAAAERLVDRVRRLRLQRHEPQRRQGPGRARRPQLHAHPAPARELADRPRPEHRHHRRQRLLLLRERLPAR